MPDEIQIRAPVFFVGLLLFFGGISMLRICLLKFRRSSTTTTHGPYLYMLGFFFSGAVILLGAYGTFMAVVWFH